MQSRTLRSVMPLAAALWLVAATGCGPSASSLCDQICDCQGCSDSQYDDCIDSYDDAERDAEQADCLPEFDDLAACGIEDGECKNDIYTTDSCAGELVDLVTCEL
ncbi:MAG: hypothetical protein U0271_31280 [Polyangiaceae bacterium]